MLHAKLHGWAAIRMLVLYMPTKSKLLVDILRDLELNYQIERASQRYYSFAGTPERTCENGYTCALCDLTTFSENQRLGGTY